jgi:hypothetical protein
VKQTTNTKLLEALCQRGLQISDAGRKMVEEIEATRPPQRSYYPTNARAMIAPSMEPVVPLKAASAAIARGQTYFQQSVSAICSAAIDTAQLPRVLAYIVAEYSVCPVPIMCSCCMG